MFENNPLPLWEVTSSVIKAAIFLSLIAPVSELLVLIIQSPTSKNLKGREQDLFYTAVLNKPDIKFVLPVWNYLVLAFDIVMSLDSSSLLIILVISSLEHNAKFNASLYWALAIYILNISENLFNLC
jgi:hypothetical protein